MGCSTPLTSADPRAVGLDGDGERRGPTRTTRPADASLHRACQSGRRGVVWPKKQDSDSRGALEGLRVDAAGRVRPRCSDGVAGAVRGVRELRAARAAGDQLENQGDIRSHLEAPGAHEAGANGKQQKKSRTRVTPHPTPLTPNRMIGRNPIMTEACIERSEDARMMSRGSNGSAGFRCNGDERVLP